MKTFLAIAAALATALAAAVLSAGPSAAPATASSSTSATLEWGQVNIAYQEARERGDSDVIDRALALADRFVSAHPADGRALTYRGSLSAMRARVSLMPWTKLSMLNDGIQQMDTGVDRILRDKQLAGSEAEIDVRMVRGITSARIPSAFGRGGVAVSDFRAVAAHPRFDQFLPVHRASTLAWLAVLAKRQGDGKASDDYLSRARSADAVTAAAIWEKFQ